MQYKIKANSMCADCKPNKHSGPGKCYPVEISESGVFQNLQSKELFIFVHDISECGGLCEVEAVSAISQAS